MSYIGIDPGKQGGLAIIREDQSFDCLAMPESQYDVLEWLRQWDLSGATACVEWIHPAIKNVGKASMSKLYGSFMASQMAMAALDIPMEVVKPRTWQQVAGIATRLKSETDTQWKWRIRCKAQQIFPSLPLWNEPRTKGKQLAIADALLIAWYCRRVNH
jgi:hypothetical protein